MKNRINYLTQIFSLIAVVFLFMSCQKEHKIDTEFFIPVKKSNLYVRLVGNADGPLIINLHGGPGAFSGFAHETYRKFLEEDYLIAYLDQRGGGKSDAATDSTMLTMRQFVEDLDVVVDTLRNRYKGKAINLIGSSWGGTLGLLYLIEHQQKINSFACISGKADGVYPILALIRHERTLTQDSLAKSNDPVAKARLNEILAKLKEIEKSGLKQFFNNMTLIKHTFPKELGFSPYWYNQTARQKAVALGSDSAYFARAHYSKTAFDSALAKMEYVNRVFRNTPAYNHLNILDEMAVIHTPVLVMQGEFDYDIGLKQASMIYAALTGVPEDKKRLRIIPDAAHNLNLEAPEQYYKIVKSFFDTYNK